MKLKLAVAIIIDETCKESDLCIESVLNQVGVDQLSLDIMVCSAGEVELPQHLVQANNLTLIAGADPELGVTGYLHRLAEHVKEHDWVWAINSNHYMHSKNALNFLADSLTKRECEHVEIASVGIAGKSFDSSIVDVRSLTDLCNTHGFFEMLGNPSSLVVRGYAFGTAFGRHVTDMVSMLTSVRKTDTTWWHAKLLFMALHNQQGAFIDYKLLAEVDPMETLAANETMPFAIGNTSSLASDLIELNFAVGDDVLWAPKFFRVGQESIWYHLAHQQYARALAYGSMKDGVETGQVELFDAMIANWQLMLTLTECVGHPKVQNTLKQLVIDGIRHTMELHQEPQLSESARRYFENCTAVTKIFSATTLDAAFVSERA